jgi:hypothetical protein
MNFSVLARSGSSSPVFGVLLAYADEANHTGIRFVTDDYDQSRPAVALVQVKNGKPTTIGEGKPVGNLAFWGRDSYELRVGVTSQEIRAWLNGRTLARWPNPGLSPEAHSGLFLLGPSRMRFDAIVVE